MKILQIPRLSETLELFLILLKENGVNPFPINKTYNRNQ